MSETSRNTSSVTTQSSTSEETLAVTPISWWALILPALGLLLLGAHGLRFGEWGITAAMVVCTGLLVTRFAWARLVCSGILLGGVVFWGKVTAQLINFRMSFGMDWTRLAIIMVAVAAFSFAGAVLLQSKRAQVRFSRNAETALPQAVVFFLVIGGLWLARIKTPLVLLLSDRFFPGSGPLQIVLMGLYGAAVCGLMLNARKARKTRPKIWALFSLVFFGQLIFGLLGVERMLMTGALHLPIPALIVAGPLFRGAGFFMLILFTVSVLLVGPAWCSHLCYVGAWDDVLSRRHKGRCKPLPAWASKARWAIAIGVFASAWGMRQLGVSWVGASWAAAAFGLVSVGIMAFVSSGVGTMAHCSAFCPLGLVGNVLGKLAPWRIRINENCTRCGACLGVCRYGALSEERLSLGKPGITCSLCRDCTAVCAHNAMHLTAPMLSPRRAELVFVVLAVSLHAIFLSVARV